MEKKLGRATRDVYGQVLVELGTKDPNVVVLDADLSKSTKSADFQKHFPDRFFNVGIMEANLSGVAAGLASAGKMPFISSFAAFLVSKGFDQFRMSIAFPNLNVKVIGSHGGISVGEDGASQMSIEDIALMASLPNFVVMVPADEFSAHSLIHQAAQYYGPVFIRTCRPKAPVLYNGQSWFRIGKGVKVCEGTDLTIVSYGLLVFEALQAAEALSKDGIKATVIDMHTIKPLDEALLVAEAKKTGHILVAEEHQIWGGLGSAVARVLSREHPCRMEFVAIQDTFAESGAPDQLLEKYGLTSPHIVRAAKRLLKQ
jgi:transketolase